LVGRFIGDQRAIWTSPRRFRFSDTEWLVPLGALTAELFATDREFSRHLSHNPTTISHYKSLSNAGLAALVGGAGGMWVMGHVSHNEHWSETGFLAGEAALNSLVAVDSFKYMLRRAGPYQGDGSGSFFQSGGTSFPSEHAAAAWSVAGVIAHEYPGPFSKIMAYGLASLVSVSRVKPNQHFPSDVLVGSLIGNLVAQNIYHRLTTLISVVGNRDRSAKSFEAMENLHLRTRDRRTFRSIAGFVRPWIVLRPWA
jgi:membrane-associated phospholipid phosphatase